MNVDIDGKVAKRTRRQMLVDCGLGFTGLAMSAMLQRDASAADATAANGAFVTSVGPARAKSVIWIFLNGGVSHLESFDPKPAINKYAGLTIDESPHAAAVLQSEFYRSNVRDFAGTPRELSQVRLCLP
jgi:hypothetical protein